MMMIIIIDIMISIIMKSLESDVTLTIIKKV